MATFYLLPPRRVVGQHFHAFLKSLFPGMAWPGSSWPDLAEALSATAVGQGDVYVVYREDLPEDADPAAALVRDFGAESGDEVIEMRRRSDGSMGEAGRWHMPLVGQAASLSGKG